MKKRIAQVLSLFLLLQAPIVWANSFEKKLEEYTREYAAIAFDSGLLTGIQAGFDSTTLYTPRSNTAYATIESATKEWALAINYFDYKALITQLEKNIRPLCDKIYSEAIRETVLAVIASANPIISNGIPDKTSPDVWDKQRGLAIKTLENMRDQIRKLASKLDDLRTKKKVSLEFFISKVLQESPDSISEALRGRLTLLQVEISESQKTLDIIRDKIRQEKASEMLQAQKNLDELKRQANEQKEVLLRAAAELQSARSKAEKETATFEAAKKEIAQLQKLKQECQEEVSRLNEQCLLLKSEHYRLKINLREFAKQSYHQGIAQARMERTLEPVSIQLQHLENIPPQQRSLFEISLKKVLLSTTHPLLMQNNGETQGLLDQEVRFEVDLLPFRSVSVGIGKTRTAVDFKLSATVGTQTQREILKGGLFSGLILGSKGAIKNKYSGEALNDLQSFIRQNVKKMLQSVSRNPDNYGTICSQAQNETKKKCEQKLNEMREIAPTQGEQQPDLLNIVDVGFFQPGEKEGDEGA